MRPAVFAGRGAAEAHTCHSTPEPRPEQKVQSPSAGRPGVIRVGYDEVAIPDVEVIDQNERKVRLYTDLLKGRVVVVSFFFTSCTLMCPLQGQVLAQLQTVLGDKMGRKCSSSQSAKIQKTTRHSASVFGQGSMESRMAGPW